MTTDLQRPPRLPPRWFIRLIWQLHRGLIRVTGGRLGLWHPTKSWGTLRLTTTGRRTGQQRTSCSATSRTARTWSPWR